MRKSTIIVIVCIVIAGFALAYGMYFVNLAAHPVPVPDPGQTTPAAGEASSGASSETKSDDSAKGEGKENASSDETESDDSSKGVGEGNTGLNEVPVTDNPASDSGSSESSGSGSSSGSSNKPFGGGIPGFSDDEIIHNPIDSGGEQPTLGESTLPDGVDPNGHTGSF